MSDISTEAQNAALQKDVQRLKNLATHWQVANSALRKDIDGLEMTIGALRDTIEILKKKSNFLESQIDIKDRQINFLSKITRRKNNVHKT